MMKTLVSKMTYCDKCNFVAADCFNNEKVIVIECNVIAECVLSTTKLSVTIN